jgi:hypothetical protein
VIAEIDDPEVEREPCAAAGVIPGPVKLGAGEQ